MAIPLCMKRYVIRLYLEAERLNRDNIRALLARARTAREVVDLGCGDGATTLIMTSDFTNARVRGVESYEPFRTEARARGIDALHGDLESRLPFDDESIDVVVANQVIEHLADTDHFVAEVHRVLRHGGLTVVSTENMASWHNIASLVLGLQPLSAANYSLRRYPLGNPFGLHSGEGSLVLEGMLHRRLFTTRALRELLEAHGFSFLESKGSGYHPLPPVLGRIEPVHAHFISLAAQKP